MKIILSTLLAITMSLTSMAEAKLPESIQHLEELVSDEKALVDATRLHHRQQIELNDWDIEILKNYKGDDTSKMAAMAKEKIQKRNDSIQLAWDYVLSAYPRNIRAVNYKGEYWYDIGGNQAGALMQWKQALALDKNFSLPHNNLGLHYFHIGDYRKGFQHLEKALELEPDNPDFLFNMTQMYLNHFPFIMEQKKLDKKSIYIQAMKYSKTAVKNAPDELSLQQDYATNFYAAENFGVKADWAKAAQAWKDTYALAKHRDVRFFSRLNEGRCWIRDGNKAKAIKALEAAQAIGPTSDVVNRLLSKVRRAKEKPSSNTSQGYSKIGKKRVR